MLKERPFRCSGEKTNKTLNLASLWEQETLEDLNKWECFTPLEALIICQLSPVDDYDHFINANDRSLRLATLAALEHVYLRPQSFENHSPDALQQFIIDLTCADLSLLQTVRNDIKELYKKNWINDSNNESVVVALYALMEKGETSALELQRLFQQACKICIEKKDISLVEVGEIGKGLAGAA